MSGCFPTLAVLLLGQYAWGPSPKAEPLSSRIDAPLGFRRIELPPESFGAWLRAFPTRPGREPVRLFDGREKGNQSAHVLTFDIDVGKRDLQQCADAVMRLRAEYLFAMKRTKDICFRFTSGDAVPWRRWAGGERPRVRGRSVEWEPHGASAGHPSFRRYLDAIFMYAGSASLSRELESGIELARILPGDVLIQGGFPGHAVIVMDVAENERGERRYLLAQSYMPAQEIHLLRNPSAEGPWYDAQAKGSIPTPEWNFRTRDLMRFSEVGCPVHRGAKPL